MKRSNVEFASKGDLRPLIQWSPIKFITFSPKTFTHIHFQLRNLIAGWTISNISTFIHQAFMALGIRLGAMENSPG